MNFHLQIILQCKNTNLIQIIQQFQEKGPNYNRQIQYFKFINIESQLIMFINF